MPAQPAVKSTRNTAESIRSAWSCPGRGAYRKSDRRASARWTLIRARETIRSPHAAIRSADRGARALQDVRRPPALDGVTLELSPGEILGLLGPNGAGKTTLVRSVAGRVAPDAGRLHLFGRLPTEPSPRALRGWVPQDLALYPLLSPRENLWAFGRYQGLAARELDAAIPRMLDWIALSERADDRTEKLSGGMKRRLNIAAGTIHRPRVLLLDEPTVGVDPQSRERIYAMIQELRDEGLSILYTTHYMEEAERLCDRIAIIDHGRIIAVGTKDELVRNTLGTARTLALEFASPVSDLLRRRLRSGAPPCSTAGPGFRSKTPARDPGDPRARVRESRSDPRPVPEDRDARVGVPAADGTGAAGVILAVALTLLAKLRRDRAAFVLSFVLPVVFFSVFALVLGGPRATRRVPLIVADEDRTPASRRFVEALGSETGLRIIRTSGGPGTQAGAPYDRAGPRDGGSIGQGVGRPHRADRLFPDGDPFRFARAGAPILLLADSSDPVAAQMLAGMMQKAALTSIPDSLAKAGWTPWINGGEASRRSSEPDGGDPFPDPCGRDGRRHRGRPREGRGAGRPGGDEEEPDRRAATPRAWASCSCSSRRRERAGPSSRKPRAARSIASSRRACR